MDRHPPIEQQLREFIASYGELGYPVRTDLVYAPLVAYCRIGKRYLPEPTDCFQIAKIDTPEKQTGQGTFWRFLDVVKATTTLPIYVELVHNERLEASLLGRGFVEIRRDLSGAADLLLRR